MPKRLHSASRARGFSIVEAMVALVVMSVGMLGIAGLYVSSLKAGRTAILRTQAVNLAADIADRIRANRSARNAYDTTVAAPCSVPGGGATLAETTSRNLAATDTCQWVANVQAVLPAARRPGDIRRPRRGRHAQCLRRDGELAGARRADRLQLHIASPSVMTRPTCKPGQLRNVRGMSMVELLVALTIGSFLMWGAITVYSRSRTTYQVSEQVSRLQENARYAVSVIEPDIRLANMWGLMNDPTVATGSALPTQTASPLSGTTTNCGTNFALNLIEIIRGDNNAYTLGPARASACNAYNNNPQPGADTITVRRVTEAATAATNNTLQLYATRSGTFSQVFKNGVAPGTLGPNAEIHDVVVDTYYIDKDSVGRRRHTGATPHFADFWTGVLAIRK